MDALEPQIEKVLMRFRIPVEDVHEILDDVMLTMLTKRHRIRDPERWLIRALSNRCLIYWRGRRRALAQVVDSGILTVLTSPDVSEGEKDLLRRELRPLVRGLAGEHRDLLCRRYGLAEGGMPVDPQPWDPRDQVTERVTCSVTAMLRRAKVRQRLVGELS